MQTLLQALRYGFRTLVKSLGFTGFAVIILALGIAANTTIFTIANVVLLHALPYRDADRLVMVWEDGALALSHGSAICSMRWIPPTRQSSLGFLCCWVRYR
jgi:hypothetical protein